MHEIDELVRRAPTPVKWFVLDASRVVDMDTAGAEALRQILTRSKERGVTFALSRVTPPLRSLLESYGLLAEIGADRLYATDREAAEAFRREGAPRRAEDGR